MKIGSPALGTLAPIPPQNAASGASLMLTTEALVAEKPKEDKGADAHVGHGHGGGY